MYLKRNLKQTCLWFNRKVKTAIRRRNKKWTLYRTTGKDSDYKRYKECRNLVVKELRKARKAFERKLASDVKSNPKSFYRYVRSKSKTKDRVGPLKDSAGNVVNDNKSMCEILNNFFASVFTQESGDVPEVSMVFNGDVSQKLSSIIITSEDVMSKINNFKDGKAPGNDGITGSQST